jgi:hypothetical protein
VDDYAGRVLADRYRLPLPPSDEYEFAETRAFDTYSGHEVLVRQVPLPEIVDAEVLDADGLAGAAVPRRTQGGRSGRATRRPADPAVRRAVEAAQAAAQIPDHPRLDQVFDVFAEDGSLWIVSERVAARPLAALLAEKPLTPYRAAEIASDVLTALRVLHAHGWTHRNITVRTVLVCEDGRVVLTGLASGAAEEALCGYAPVPEPEPDTADDAEPDDVPGPLAGPGERPRHVVRLCVVSCVGLRLRYRRVAAQRLLGRAGRQSGEDDTPVLADEHRAHRDVPVRPAVGVQDTQGGEDVGGDLGRPVRRERLLREQRRQRPGRHAFAHYPQRAVLGEDVEDLVQPGVVGNLRGRLGRLDRPPDRRVCGAPCRPAAPAALGTPRHRRAGEAVRVEHLGVDDLWQRHLPHQDFMAAVGVERTRLREFVLVGRRQRQAVAVGEHPSRIVVHDASPSALSPGRYRNNARSRQIRSLTGLLSLRTVRGFSRYVSWVSPWG